MDLPPTRFDLPGVTQPVYIATQQWALEPWEGEDGPELPKTWRDKHKFSVNGSRSCAELAVLRRLQGGGWDGFWVYPFNPPQLLTEWPWPPLPGPRVTTITQTGAPEWAVKIFDCLRAQNGGKLAGFFDVFAWREPGEIRFYEVKVVPGDRITDSQREFVERALRLGRRLEEFTIIEVPRPTARVLSGERASEVYIQTAQPGGGAWQDPGETTADVLARMEASHNASPYLGPAAEALQALGYELRPSNLRKPGTKPRENHLRIMHPAYTAHGIGFLKPSNVTFTRRSDRGPLSGLSGAKLTDREVIFSIANGIEEALSAAKLIARLITASGA